LEQPSEFCTGVYKKEGGREPWSERTRELEAEESQLLEAAVRERLVKIADWKRLNGGCGDL
jgi:hypothetical protein